jgi:hypothetical protein
MFRDGAQVTLMDGSGAADLDYDAAQDKLKLVTAANEASFVGLRPGGRQRRRCRIARWRSPRRRGRGRCSAPPPIPPAWR